MSTISKTIARRVQKNQARVALRQLKVWIPCAWDEASNPGPMTDDPYNEGNMTKVAITVKGNRILMTRCLDDYGSNVNGHLIADI